MAKRARVYGIGKPFEDVFPIPISSTSAPASSDTGFEVGQIWIRTSTDQAYILTSVVAGSATWALSSPGASDVDSLTGDSGGAISPAAGNITLAGGTNITSAGAGSTITLNLDAAITLATSVTSALYTTAAGTDLLITAVAGQDVVMKLSDAAGAQKFSITDSADAEVFAVDSNGGQTYTTITASGLITAQASMTVSTAGTALNLGSDNSGDAVNLGVGTTARAIGIGNSAAAHVITIGSVTGASQVVLNSGTAGIQMASTGAGDITIDSDDTLLLDADGVLELNSSAGAINIGNDADAFAINVGTGAAARTVTVGNGTGASSVVLDCGTGALNVGTNAVAHIVTVGNVTGASAVNINVGTGNFALEGNVASTYAISGTGANTGTITISGGTGAQTTNIATGATGVKTVNIGTGAIGNVVTIGTVTAAASLDLLCGTGNFTVEGNVASTYEISSTGANTGTCKFASGTGARTVEIAGGGTGIKTVNIGAAATADVITIGTTTGAGSLVLAAGTGDITMSGTVKEIDAEFIFSSGTDLTVSQSPIMQSAATTGAAPTGANGDVNLMYMQDGCLIEQFIIGTQTIIAPRMSANGLAIELDNTNAEGVEYNFGARNSAKHAYTIGTSPAFFFEAKMKVADLSGCAPLMIGFRKVEANNATLASYTDYFCAGINQATSAVNVVLLDELNGGGQTATTSTDAWGSGDGTSATIRVLVSASGVCTYTIDGVAPSATNAMTFDSADVVMPFIHLLNGADVAGEVALESLKCGFQA